MFIETTFKDSKKVKRIRNYVLMQFILVFPDLTKAETFAEKMLMSAELKRFFM